MKSASTERHIDTQNTNLPKIHIHILTVTYIYTYICYGKFQFLVRMHTNQFVYILTSKRIYNLTYLHGKCVLTKSRIHTRPGSYTYYPKIPTYRNICMYTYRKLQTLSLILLMMTVSFL